MLGLFSSFTYLYLPLFIYLVMGLLSEAYYYSVCEVITFPTQKIILATKFVTKNVSGNFHVSNLRISRNLIISGNFQSSERMIIKDVSPSRNVSSMFIAWKSFEWLYTKARVLYILWCSVMSLYYWIKCFCFCCIVSCMLYLLILC